MLLRYAPREMIASLLAVLCWLAVATAAFAAETPVTYVVLGEAGAVSARAIVAGGDCPAVDVDGRRLAMTVRAPAQTLPQRRTASTPDLSKPSAFPVTVCEATIPPGARRAVLLGHRLPLPPARIDRIVVIGDTGCRLKGKSLPDGAFQACSDADAYPFAEVAARAAAWKPDIVVHVGDYQYRENPCPGWVSGCEGSPWGYGWDTWNADFFTPAAPLLAAAPMVLARGNHESCARAGQGWFRMLDPRALEAGRDCVDAGHDDVGDYSAPYAVPLGSGAQIVVMDLAIANDIQPQAPTDPHTAQFHAAFADLKRLAGLADSTLMVTHKPVLGVAARSSGGAVTLSGGTVGIQSVFAAEDPNLFPPGVDVLLAGHVHVWEQVSFKSPHPTQFVAGFSGTQEDIVPLPLALPAGLAPAPGAIPEGFSSWVDGFGYMTMERAGPRRWDVKVWNVAGEVVNRCRIEGRHSVCDKPQVH